MKYPTFNPEDPESFETLSFRARQELSEADKEAYQQELDAWVEWKRKQEEAVALTPLPDDGTLPRLKEYADRMRVLAAAIMDAGFAVVFRDSQGGYVSHPSRSRFIEIWKDNQSVGNASPWCPNYSARPRGWEVNTNRYRKPRSYSWRASPKYFKKLESAVAHIVATAVPKRDIEAEREKAEAERSELSRRVSNTQSMHAKLLKGGAYQKGPDGLLEELLLLMAVNKREEALAKLNERLTQVQYLGEDYNEAKKAYDTFMEETYKPLMERLAEELPELYG